MRIKRLTVADVRAMKGKHQFTMVRTENFAELEAAESAGVDMVSVTPEMMVDPTFRDIAPTVFAVPGVNFYELGTPDDFTRWAFKMLRHSADAVYVSAGLPTIRRLAEDDVPVIGHVGLIPSRATWTGGFKAVGKTAASAMAVYRSTRALEDAGAFGAEIEVVPTEVAVEISRRTSLFLVSMGSGTGGDCQYLFGCDILGANRGHIPRHAKAYRNFAAEFDRLQAERVGAFSEFVADVRSGAFPEDKHIVHVESAELGRFRAELAALDDRTSRSTRH
jgi:3-methyl-2-oxobutanoate hydroxymethyltransferase